MYKIYVQKYIQNWDNKSKNSSKLNFLYGEKKTNYNKSLYLDHVVNIEHRILIIKFRLVCSKLRTHCFISKNETDKCKYCATRTEDLTHFLINCPEYIVYRNKFDENNKNIVIIF